MADLGGSDLDAFRYTARDWLEANFPGSLVGQQGRAMMVPGEKPQGDLLRWKLAIAEAGWCVPTWPKEYGGGGLSAAEAQVLQEEMTRVGAFNPVNDIGQRMLGPTLLEFGTEDQKKRHVPAIARGEVRWCQGYSEPGAGSDLASLQTKCVDAGDHWLVNGQKIWTSGAQYADWIFCLVRTDPAARKHEGISFVLINMRQPGVDARPIGLIAGGSPFCETFFTDVRVEKDDMVGPPNGGWTIAKRLAQFERSTHDGRRASGWNVFPTPVDQLAKTYIGLDESGRLADPDLRTRITKNLIDERSHGLMVDRALAEARANLNPTAASSLMKNSAAWVGQERAQLTLEIMGYQGLGWEGTEFSPQEIQAVRVWLNGRCATIGGGSQEIQNNIVSKRILGLPEMTQHN